MPIILSDTISSRPSFQGAKGKVTYLTLIKDLLRDLPFQHLRRLLLLQELILPERQESLEEILAQREPSQDSLPWEKRPVEEPGELLLSIVALWSAYVYTPCGCFGKPWGC